MSNLTRLSQRRAARRWAGAKGPGGGTVREVVTWNPKDPSEPRPGLYPPILDANGQELPIPVFMPDGTTLNPAYVAAVKAQRAGAPQLSQAEAASRLEQTLIAKQKSQVARDMVKDLQPKLSRIVPAAAVDPTPSINLPVTQTPATSRPWSNQELSPTPTPPPPPSPDPGGSPPPGPSPGGGGGGGGGPSPFTPPTDPDALLALIREIALGAYQPVGNDLRTEEQAIISAYQQAAGLPSTGTIDDATLASIQPLQPKTTGLAELRRVQPTAHHAAAKASKSILDYAKDPATILGVGGSFVVKHFLPKHPLLDLAPAALSLGYELFLRPKPKKPRGAL